MGKYYCDYCDVYLTHDSAAVRKQHNDGNRHKQNVCSYYLQLIAARTQAKIDRAIEEFEAKIAAGTLTPTYGLSTVEGAILVPSHVYGGLMPTAPPPQRISVQSSAMYGNGSPPSARGGHEAMHGAGHGAGNNIQSSGAPKESPRPESVAQKGSNAATEVKQLSASATNATREGSP